MAGHPDLGIGVQRRDVVIQVLGSVVVAILVAQGGDETGRVARVGRRLAVADLAPQKLAALAAAAAEEKIVVDLVVGRRFGAVKHGGRGALETDDHGCVVSVREDVPTQAVRLPAKVLGVVEAAADVLPRARMGLEDVGVRGHAGETQDRLLVGDIGPGDGIQSPVGGRQLDGPALGPSPRQDTVDDFATTVGQALDGHGLGQDVQARCRKAGILRRWPADPYGSARRHVEASVQARIGMDAVVKDVAEGQVGGAADGQKRKEERYDDA